MPLGRDGWHRATREAARKGIHHSSARVARWTILADFHTSSASRPTTDGPDLRCIAIPSARLPDREMHPELPALFLEFVARFNRGEFWESHEVLEGAWRAHRSSFYKGLILYASAYVHVLRGNARGIRAQLEKAERHLAMYHPSYLGLDVGALLENAEHCRRLVEANSHAHAMDWTSVIPRVHLTPNPALVRGDEPELHEG